MQICTCPRGFAAVYCEQVYTGRSYESRYKQIGGFAIQL